MRYAVLLWSYLGFYCRLASHFAVRAAKWEAWLWSLSDNPKRCRKLWELSETVRNDQIYHVPVCVLYRTHSEQHNTGFNTGLLPKNPGYSPSQPVGIVVYSNDIV